MKSEKRKRPSQKGNKGSVDKTLDQTAELFAALADPVRLRLVALLRESPHGEINACRPLDSLKLSQPTVSYHFKVLHKAGLVTREKRSQWVFYRLDEKTLAMLSKHLLQGATG